MDKLYVWEVCYDDKTFITVVAESTKSAQLKAQTDIELRIKKCHNRRYERAKLESALQQVKEYQPDVYDLNSVVYLGE